SRAAAGRRWWATTRVPAFPSILPAMSHAASTVRSPVARRAPAASPALAAFAVIVGIVTSGAPVAAQATPASPPAPSAAASPSSLSPGRTVLPPPPSEPVYSGDSTARKARARIYLARGDAALAAGMRDTARVAWETALYEYPGLTDASVELATMLVENGDGWFARKLIERALFFDPQNPKLLHFSAHRKPAPADSAGR